MIISVTKKRKRRRGRHCIAKQFIKSVMSVSEFALVMKKDYICGQDCVLIQTS